MCPKYSNVFSLPLYLDVGVLCADVSICQVWKVLEIQDKRLGLLLGLRLWKNSSGTVLGV